MSGPSSLTLSTSHPDEAHQFLATMYASHTVRLKGRVDRFRFRFYDENLGDQGWSLMNYSHEILLTDVAPFRQIVMGRVLDGSYTCWMGSDEITASRGEWVLLNPDLPAHMAWSPDIKLAIARFDRAALDPLTAGLSGHNPDQLMRYPLSRPRSRGHARALDHLHLYLKGLMGNETTRDSTLVRDQAFRLVAANLLDAFDIDASAPGPQSSEHVGPASLRRAIAFIDDHHDANIGLSEIAAAARVSPRALQHAFRDHLGTTPLAYMRRARLDSAHHDLQEADPGAGATVTDIATRWGFTNPSRFATAYRRLFGRLPSQTLHKLTGQPGSAAAAVTGAAGAGRGSGPGRGRCGGRFVPAAGPAAAALRGW